MKKLSLQDLKDMFIPQPIGLADALLRPGGRRSDATKKGYVHKVNPNLEAAESRTDARSVAQGAAGQAQRAESEEIRWTTSSPC